MNQILYNASYSTRKNRIMIAILVLLIVAVICLSTIFAINNKSNENIIKNVFASGRMSLEVYLPLQFFGRV